MPYPLCAQLLAPAVEKTMHRSLPSVSKALAPNEHEERRNPHLGLLLLLSLLEIEGWSLMTAAAGGGAGA